MKTKLRPFAFARVQSVAVKKICPLPPFLARVIGNMKVNYYFSRFYCRYTWKSNHTSKRSTNLFFPGLERFIIIYEKDCRLQLIPNVHRNGNGMGFNFVALYMQVLGSNTRQWIRNVPLRSFQHSVVIFSLSLKTRILFTHNCVVLVCRLVRDIQRKFERNFKSIFHSLCVIFANLALKTQKYLPMVCPEKIANSFNITDGGFTELHGRMKKKQLSWVESTRFGTDVTHGYGRWKDI